MTNRSHGVSLESRPCMWKGCNEETKVDVSLESTKFGKSWGLTVSGWCKLHTKAYNIYHKMERERFGDVTAKIYRENKRELDMMRKHAEKLAKQQMMQTNEPMVNPVK